MDKKHKYTILTVFLALTFSFGSMKGTDLILKSRERQLLEENGKILPGSSILEWQEKDILTMEQMEEAVKHWEKSEKWTAHDPVSGQISMERAIKGGKDWIIEMGIAREDWEENAAIDLGAVNAVLGMAEMEETGKEQAEPQDSFWKVEFSNGFIQGFLYVNAVTGKVWEADITLFEYLPEQMPYWKLKTFVELAGLQPSYKGAVKNLEEAEALWEIEDSQLCAKMEFLHSLGLPSDSGADENGELDAGGKKLMKECVNIIFKLTADKVASEK